MKLTLTRGGALSLTFRRNTLRRRPSSSTAVTASLPDSSSIQLQTPLVLRPPTHSAPLSSFRQWHRWAKSMAASSDGGPDSSHLLRELRWLAEDALDDPSSVFPQLPTGLAPSDEGRKIKLRTPLEDLYALWKQRVEKRRPFQYIVGCEHWRDLVLSVQEGVLIPRPETELIVDLVGDVVSRDEGLREGLWADLGTGSGAIAIGIARVLGPRGRVIATDLSHVAVAVGSYNVRKYGLEEKVEIRQGSWFEPLEDVEGKLAGLVSNPPYIPSDHIPGLQAEVGKHEPRLALDGGADGMDDLLHLCSRAALMLKPGGYFSFETNGENQSIFLINYLRNDFEESFCNLAVVRDFAGIQRFVTGFRL